MARMEPIAVEQAPARARELLDEPAARGREPGAMVQTLARQGTATDPATAAIVAFGLQVIAAPAEITDADVDGLRAHGYTDEQIAEVVGIVALMVLTGAFNLVAAIRPSTTARSVA